ncbi:MAG: C25 family cysteine peptidase [Bacteroidota bacterium]
MRKIYHILLFSLLTYSGFAQTNGNEWIVYGQKYYYFQVIRSGIHRIDYNTMVAAGIDVSTINPKNFQVFGREKELYIHVEGEQDNVFDPTDYIEFYADKNDAWLDSLVYDSTGAMPDMYYSLVNDTICYYLTWNSSLTNRRMVVETDTNYSSYTTVNWWWKKNYYKESNYYLFGEQVNGASSSFLRTAEGWAAEPVNGVAYGGYTFSYAMSTPGYYSGVGAPDATVFTSSAGASYASTPLSTDPNHHLRIKYGPSSTIAYDTTFRGYKHIKTTFTVPNTDLGVTTAVYYEIVTDLGVATDYQSVFSTTIIYPHSNNMGGALSMEMFVPFNSSESKTRLSLNGFAGGPGYNLYDITDTVKRIPLTLNGAVYEAIIPNHNSGINARCFYNSASDLIQVTQLNAVNGNGGFTNYPGMDISDAYIIITHPSLMTEATNYSGYRASIAGGSHNTVVVNAEELYHQYGGGIQKHGIAFRRFCKDMMDEWPTNPRFLFLMGKSIRDANEGGYEGSRKDVTNFQNNLVPSYGYPCSDNLITAGLAGNGLRPAIPTGRLSAVSPQEVTDYLNKMIQYEALQDPNTPYTIEDKEWMKRVMHFSGGSNTSEQILFQSFLYGFGRYIEDTLFGADINTFAKTSSQPINPIEYDEVMNNIENGTALMTFFGHSSVSGFDQNLDEPQNWTNGNGKYPFLIGNACYTGDIHQPTPSDPTQKVSASEKFTLISNKGVIGFLASVKLGFTGPLYTYSSYLYKQFSWYNYGKSVGEQVVLAIDSSQYTQTDFIPLENACTQVTLHGDPALKLHYHMAPELVVRQQDIFFEPTTITLADDSMNVNVIVTNIGKATSDTIIVELRRGFPNGADSLYTQTLLRSLFKDTIVFRVPVQHNIAVGINTFDVSVDIPDFVDEHYDELGNNITSTTFFINSNAVAPVYPYEFAIVPDSAITFKASTLNALAPVTNYRFEIDTSSKFNSPALHYQVVNSGGGVVEATAANWLLANSTPDPLIFTDSTVYFWRVSPDSSVYYWLESSFQYINNLTGWGQAHFDQFEGNYHQTLNYDTINKGWTWNPNIRRIDCNVFGNATNSSEFYGTNWYLDNDLQDYSGCGSTYPAIHVGVIDPISLESWGTYNCPTTDWSCTCVMVNPDHQFGNKNNGCGSCRARVEKFFIFDQEPSVPEQLDSLVSMVNNKIPDGHYVLIYTWLYADYSQWTPQMYTMFSSLGADSIYAGRPNAPFIVLARVGDPSQTKVVIGDSIGSFISLTDSLFGFDYIGSMTSETAGPAAKWESLYWQQETVDSPVSTDTARLSVIGITAGGTEQVLVDTLFTSLDSIIDLNPLVDANTYPYVKLKGWFKDTAFFTPAQTKRWQLVYTPVPEAAVNSNLGFYVSALTDSLDEGQDMSFAIAVENISEYDMDSLLVFYWIEDENRVKNYISYPRQDSLRSGEILLDTITFSTKGYGGLNSIWIEVNPDPSFITFSVYDQPEQYHFNNFAQVPFYVNRDITNPILDVTFDGIHILNGDIVSPNPEIFITLNDENPWLVMDSDEDTASFAVYLTDPAGNQDRVYFWESGVQQLIYTPSTGPQDKFKIQYNPRLLADGKYTLLIQASDKTGNLSGTAGFATDKTYTIDFEVVNASTITEIMNYPNPFTTKTHFVFTLTGSELPEFMNIQIMTITGKVVKEIGMDELGTLRIGRNITDYYWDGTDEFGDRLANGVYLYRVIAKINGEDIEKRESGADAHFKKGFGKMYLMR